MSRPVTDFKRKAWDTFSLYIRLRDKRCVTCGSENQLQAGHFWHNVLDFDEENLNCQCKRCNHFLSGNLAQYAVYLLGKLGKEKFDALDIRHTRALSGEKRSDQDFKNLIEIYENKIKECKIL